MRVIKQKVSPKLTSTIAFLLVSVTLTLLNISAAIADGFGSNLNAGSQVGDVTDPKLNDQDGCTSQPVSLYTGAKIYSHEDLNMKGLYPIRLVRMYSSQSRYDSPLGYGWAFAHDRRLFEYPDGSVKIRYGCGWHDTFVKTGGTYQTPVDGLEGVLTENADGTFERRYRNGAVDIFDEEGRLVVSRSPLGHQLEYEYDPAGLLPLTGTSPFSVDPNTPMVVAYNYHLTTIRERAADGVLTGRNVTFNYEPNTGRIDNVVTSDGRTITYNHDDAGNGLTTGNLESVVGLEGITSTYLYEDPRDSHNVTSFQEGAGTTPYVKHYDDLDRVDRETYGSAELIIDYTITFVETRVTKRLLNDVGNLIYEGNFIYTFSPQGYVETVTDPLRNQKVIQRDGRNHLDRVEYKTNIGTSLSPILKTSSVVEYDFDAQGNKTHERIHLGDGGTIFKRWTYDNGWVDSYEVTSDVPPYQDFRTEFTFYRDNNNIPTNIHEIRRKRQNDTFQVITLTHDNKNRLSHVQFHDAHVLRVLYEDNHLFPTRVYHEISGQISPFAQFRMDYDAQENLAWLWDGRNNLTRASYDDLGRVTTLTNALNEQTIFTYEDRRLETLEIGRVQQPNGDGIFYDLVYDEKNRVTEVLRRNDAQEMVNFWSYTYDSEGNVRSATDGEGRRWLYLYDLVNKLRIVQDSFNNVWRYRYDALGNVREVTNPNLDVTKYTYDGASRLTQVEELGVSPSLVTRFTYNALGQIASVEDPKHQVTNYHYDNLGRLISVIQPLGQAVQYFYDTRNRLDFMLNARGQKIDPTYYPWGPVEQIRYFANNSTTAVDRTVSYQYDNSGNLSHVTDSAVQSGLLYQYQYDELNRPDIVTAYNVAGINRQLDHDYDHFGNRERLTVSNWNGSAWVEDFVQNYTFNKLNQLDNARLITAGLINFDYYNNDEQRQIAFPSGVTNDFAHYDNGPLHWVQIANGNGVQERIEYTYDRLLNVQDYTDNDGIHSFGYDGVSRLTSATHPQALQGLGMNISESYSYDDADNREDPVNAALYDYNSNNQIQQSPGVTSYSFDDSGNMTGRSDGAVLTYDHENRLATFSRIGISAAYTYDPFSRRISKNSNGITTAYLWDGRDIIAEYNSTGTRTRRYAYSPYAYAPIQYEDFNGVYDVHLDHLGTPRNLTNQNGDVVWRATYETFGKAFINNDVDGDQTQVIFDVRFPGQWADSESGLYYNYFRYYDPSLGRYISSDPIGQMGGINIHIYASSNPANYIDTLGLDVIDLSVSLGGGPGGQLGLQIDTDTGDVFGYAGLGVGLGVSASATYLVDIENAIGENDGNRPSEGFSWVASGKGGIGGWGGKISGAWDATHFSETGEHDPSAKVGGGLVGGANVGLNFRGTWEIGNLGDSLAWWLEFLELYPDDAPATDYGSCPDQ